jgi:hypothetical protein
MANGNLPSVGNTGPILIAATALASYDSGPQMLAAKRYTKWTFHLEGTFTNYSVLIYGTTDDNTAGWIGYPPTTFQANWFPLPAPSMQAGAGTVQNPLTAVGQSMTYVGPLVAVRAVFTGTSQTGTCGLYGFAVP